MLFEISDVHPKNLNIGKENINTVNYFVIGHYVIKNKKN